LSAAKEKFINEKISKILWKLFSENFRNALIELKLINKVVISGNSVLMEVIKKCTENCCGSDVLYTCDPFDIIEIL
jgi:hypothetical protein